MASVGRKLANLQNLARGRNSKKKTPDARDGSGYYLPDDVDISRDTSSHEALDPHHPHPSSVSRTSSLGVTRTSKSGSMGSINSDSADGSLVVDQDEILSLTHDIRSFSEALTKMKAVFTLEEGGCTESVRVVAHEKLGDLLCILKTVLQKYPGLHSTDVLSTAGQLISKIKHYPYEEGGADFNDLHETIDQLAITFSSSVSDYLMGDVETGAPSFGKTRSYENLPAAGMEPASPSDSPQTHKTDGATFKPEDLDTMLMNLEPGVDLALKRAKAWSKYAKDIITYVDKRAHLEAEFAKNVSKLAQHIRPAITEERAAL